MTDPREILTRPAPAPDLTLRYGEHPDQIIDLRLPLAETEPRPLIVFIHGGFWRSTVDRGYGGSLAADLALRGHPVASIEFRRAGQPGGGQPGTFDDVSAALAALPALLTDAAGFRGMSTSTTSDSSTFPESVRGAGPFGAILLGHSSGGHLALWAAATGRHGSLVISGVLALAPVCDLVAAHRMGIGEDAVANLLGDAVQQPDLLRAIDPMALPTPTMPTVIVHGDADQRVPISQARDYVARHPGVRLVDLAGVDHFAPVDPRSLAWPAVLAALATL